MECPYPHDKKFKVEEAGAIFLCDGGKKACFQPIMVCGSCGATNRTLANFCRSCGKAILYGQREAELIEKMSLSQTTHFQPRIRSFRDYEVDGFSLLHVYKGFLIVGTTDGRIFVTDCLNLKVPIKEFKVSGAPVAVSSSTNSSEDGVMISTRNAAYKLSFLPNLDCSKVASFDSMGEIKGSAYSTQHGLVGLVARGENTSVILDHEREVKRFDLGEPTSSATLADTTLYFISQTHLYRFETETMQLASTELPEDDWNLKQAPIHDTQGEQIYLCSKNHVYHVSTRDATGRPMRVPDNSFVNFRIVVHSQKLLVAHSKGLTVLNSFHGRRIWDLKTDMFVDRTAADCAPMLVGDYVLFVSLNTSGRQEVSLIPARDILADNRDASADILTVDEFDHIPIEPVFGLGSLIIANSSEQKLAIYRLVP